MLKSFKRYLDKVIYTCQWILLVTGIILLFLKVGYENAPLKNLPGFWIVALLVFPFFIYPVKQSERNTSSHYISLCAILFAFVDYFTSSYIHNNPYITGMVYGLFIAYVITVLKENFRNNDT